ncbi:SEC-C metal-binding domain-containing protein [Oxobacter pfennigii]|nr:SEC-C metal-binding domain-containing protein [Oxobacter pfennigii]
MNVMSFACDFYGQANRTRTKLGRNDPCPFGSGKKYKKCCGK